MKKLLLMFLAAGSAACVCSCESLGVSGKNMDTVEATAEVVETVRKNIDPETWKIYGLRWQEGEELGNELQRVTVYLVNRDGNCFTQYFTLSGPAKGNISDLSEATSQNPVEFDKVNGISLDAIDPAAIQQQYETAKGTIPEEYTFKSISSYEIMEQLSSGVELFDRGKNIGQIKTSFDVNVTENGKEYIESAGKKSLQYYQSTFDVQPDGTVVMRD